MEELASLPTESRELALRCFELLRPYLDGLLSLRSVAKDQGIPYRTAARWVAGYRKDGLAGCAVHVTGAHAGVAVPGQ